MSVVIEHVSFTYMPGTQSETRALIDISLNIETGEIFGVIGHTGSGKSTLIQHINGLLKPTDGKVWVDELEVSAPKQPRKLLVSKAGIAFQYPEYQLFEETVYKDIAFGPKNIGLDEAETDARIREAAELVDLDLSVLGNKSPFELSGGEKRKVALCGVLAMRPDVLILDEPMAGLDPFGRESILRLVRELKQRGHTVIMVSHSMDDVARVCDRIAVLHKGELKLLGTPEEVFRSADELREMGLDMPAAAKLSEALNRMGKEVPGGLNSVDSLSEYLIKRIKTV